MAASARRVGAETSKTRDTLLDHVEKMMLDEGYASVTYRGLAAAAGVTPSLVQYYFPTLDDIFLSAIRRYSERSQQLLDKVLEKRPEDPLRALWEFSRTEASGALMTEFMPALQMLISGLPKFLNLEEGIGVQTAHREVTTAFEKYLDTIEPAPAPKRKPAQRRSR